MRLSGKSEFRKIRLSSISTLFHPVKLAGKEKVDRKAAKQKPEEGSFHWNFPLE